MEAFRAYDIRGIFGTDLTTETAYKVGYFIPRLLQANKVLVGRDVRVSSDELFEALANGITDAGADVYNTGLATTPMVYYLTAKLNFDASVQITASHNPKEYNGLKVSKTNALPVGYIDGLNQIEAWIENNEAITPLENKGQIFDSNKTDIYLDFLKKQVPDFENLKIAVDCSNGMASLLIHQLLGKSPIYIYDTLDGTFPNHSPNPLKEENVADLKKLVLKNNCDVGIIFDGDADRVMFVDEKGQFISPDLMIGVLGHHFLKNRKGNVLFDIRTSRSTSEYIEKMGATTHLWRVGHSFAKLKMRELNAIFGGELAGHYYFSDFYNCDSGIYTALIVLKVLAEMKKNNRKLSELIKEIAVYSFSGEINFKVTNKDEVMQKILNDLTAEKKPIKIFDFDGYRIEYPDWWVNIRPSNTEPYLRLVVEAENDNLLKQKVDYLTRLIHSAALL